MMEFLLMVILIFAGIPVLIGFLCYFIPKKLGYPRVAKYLTWTYVLAIVCFLCTIIFEDQLFTRREAGKLVKEQGIELHDEFSLEDNKSMWGIADYYHTFILEISPKDKQQIIEKIQAAPGFRKAGSSDDNLRSRVRYLDVEEKRYYETDTAFVQEWFRPSEPGYAPVFRRVTVNKNGHYLIFEDIDD